MELSSFFTYDNYIDSEPLLSSEDTDSVKEW